MKNIHVAVALDQNGYCISVLKCKVIDQQELDKLKEQVELYNSKVLEEKEKLLQEIANLQKKYEQVIVVLKQVLGLDKLDFEELKT